MSWGPEGQKVMESSQEHDFKQRPVLNGDNENVQLLENVCKVILCFKSVIKSVRTYASMQQMSAL